MTVKGRCAAINFMEKLFLTLLPHTYTVKTEELDEALGTISAVASINR
jgi:hypothetical protein